MTSLFAGYPPTEYPVIVAGKQWHWEFNGTDSETGEPFDWTSVAVRSEIRHRSGRLLVVFDSTGDGDGDVTRGTDGILAFDLAAAFTEDLPITRRWTGTNLDMRIAMWRTQGAHAFDVVVTKAGKSWTIVDGKVEVQEPVTTGGEA